LKARPALLVLLLTAAALLIHGYHPYSEDSAFYIPPVKKLLNPALYPQGAEFFQSHARLTLFPRLMEWSVRTSHLSLDIVLLAWHLLCIFLFLFGCWKVACLCFEEPAARWCSVALVTALLTLPVAGTALFVMDQYVNPRSFSSVGVVFSVACALERRRVWAVAWLLAAGLIHPLMPVYGVFFLIVLTWYQSRSAKVEGLAAMAVLGFSFEPPGKAYHQAAGLHSYHYVTQWPWYAWLGVFAPVGLFFWFGRIARERHMPNVDLLCRSLVPYVLVSLLGALLLDIPRRFEALARLQPMRSLHLAYVLLVLLIGGMGGQFVLKRSMARWLPLFVPLCAGMACVQFALFPATTHVEWPGVASRNAWVEAFDWVRKNTPVDAYFALDPWHMDEAGEDQQSFRAIAERSMLVDEVKDSGSVAMFPSLADEWWDRVSALKDWKSFQPVDFQSLKRRYGVNWVVVKQPGIAGLECPYVNEQVRVCRLD